MTTAVCALHNRLCDDWDSPFLLARDGSLILAGMPSESYSAWRREAHRLRSDHKAPRYLSSAGERWRRDLRRYDCAPAEARAAAVAAATQALALLSAPLPGLKRPLPETG